MRSLKIKKIELKNFQGHVDSSIYLDQGLNAFIGSSSAGKSTIAIKALEWMIYNTIGGESRYGVNLHSHQIQETKNNKIAIKGETSATFTLTDNTVISKIKDKKTTRFTIQKEKENMTVLTANGLKTPEAILDIFKFESPNLAIQWDSSYLLFDTPGSIAKELNNAINMTLPDKVLSKIKSEVRKNNMKITLLKEEIEDVEEELRAYEILDSLSGYLDKLEIIFNKKVKEENELQEAINHKNILIDIELKLSRYSHFDELTKRLKVIASESLEMGKKDEELLLVEGYRDDLKYMIKQLDEYQHIERNIELLSVLEDLLKLKESQENTLDDYLFYRDSLNQVDKQLKELPSNNMSQLLSEIAEDHHRVVNQEELTNDAINALSGVRSLFNKIKENESLKDKLESELTDLPCPLCGNIICKGEK